MSRSHIEHPWAVFISANQVPDMSFIMSLLRYLLLTLLLAAIAITILVNRDTWLPFIDPNAAGSEIDRLPPDDRMAREAIIQGVQAFYAFDSQTGKDVWLANLCQVMSQAGCKLTSLGAERLWLSLGDQTFLYSAEVEVLEKVSDRPANETNKKATQVWKIRIDLNQPLPGSPKQSDEVYALVVTEDGQWRFERFLTPQESEPFEQEPSQ
jgi:hypothetical protein